jgi:cell division protein ZapA (FtsZ GTPase activity inhibitor)
MSSAIKKYKLSIFGEAYTLISDEPEEVLTSCAMEVDALMRDISQKSQSIDAKRIAVLAALQMATHAKCLEDSLEYQAQWQIALNEEIDQLLAQN